MCAGRRPTEERSGRCGSTAQPARSLGPNYSQWEVVLERVAPGAFELTAASEDEAGNVEKNPHRMSIMVGEGERGSGETEAIAGSETVPHGVGGGTWRCLHEAAGVKSEY